MRSGAQRLDLDLLPTADAVTLLRALIGGRADADPAAVQALADRCCRLPLALRVAAELCAARPAVPVAELVAELTDQHRKLDLLQAGGDPGTAVRAVFSWSYRHLDDNAARTFRLLGLHPGPDIDLYAAAALTAATVDQAGVAFNGLARAYLIQNAGPGRYALHDLLRAYAHELAAGQDREDERRAALTRLFDHYLYTAAVAMDSLHPAERRRRPYIVPPATPAVTLTSQDAAKGWLDAHRACLVTVTTYAAGNGWPGHAVRLAAVLSRYLMTGSHYFEALTVHGTARRAARRLGDKAAEATALTDLGVNEWILGRYQQSARRYQQALDLFRENGDRLGGANVLVYLGLGELRQCHYQQAIELFQESLATSREYGDRSGEADSLNGLGEVFTATGQSKYAMPAALRRNG